jgi:general secretion pathway protein D
MGAKACFWMKIFVLCVVFGIVGYPGGKTGLRPEPIGEFFKEQGDKIVAIQKATPIFDLVAQASPSQPSTPTPTSSQPPTASEPPTPTPVQPSEIPTPKPVPPLQTEPSSPTPTPPSTPSQPSTASQSPTPSPVQPAEVPTPKPVPLLQPQPLPAPSPPTPVAVPTPPGPPPSPRKRFVPQPSTSPTPQPSTSATRPPSGPIQPSLPTTGPRTAIAVAPSTSQAAPPSPPAAQVPPQAGSGVVFNFDNADLYEVIRVMSEIMKINYIVDPKVRGAVNIHTSGQISAQDVFAIFQSILRLNGATAVKRDGVYEIVPLGDAKKLPISPSTTRESGKPPSEERYTIQIIVLKYIPVIEVSKMIKPFLSDGADIVEHPPNNILIIGDLASNVKKSVDIIHLFDIDIFTDLRVRIYPITNADVNEIAKEMERIFASFEVSTKSGRGVGITFTPVVRINSLLVVSSIPNIFEKVEGWLKELDKIPMEGTKYSVFVYYVQNAKAKDLADVLKQIYVTTKEKKTEFKEKVTEQPTTRGVRPAPTPPSAPPSTTAEGGAVPEGEINIVVDETNNALVVRAFARDYKSILETVKKLDIYPKQVLIEVFLAEVSLDNSNKFGIEWGNFVSSHLTDQHAQGAVLGAQPPADPFSQALSQYSIRYSIVELGGRLSAAINAAASEDRLKVISSPHIIASNNKEAKIQVGSSQPILSSTYSYGSTTTSGTIVTSTTTPSTGVIEGTIEYKDIGIIISVTPRISDGGLVSLEISIEKSTVNSSAIPLGNLQNVPVFGKKTAKTILAVTEGQTIVIGGLIEESREKISKGIPLLSKIPLLGGLFGFQEYDRKTTELVLLLTPHVITDHIKSETVTDEFKEKVEGLKKELEKERKKKEKK